MDSHWSGDLRKPDEQKVWVIAGWGILAHECDLRTSGTSPKPRYRQGIVLTSRLPQYLKEQDAQQMTTKKLDESQLVNSKHITVSLPHCTFPLQLLCILGHHLVSNNCCLTALCLNWSRNKVIARDVWSYGAMTTGCESINRCMTSLWDWAKERQIFIQQWVLLGSKDEKHHKQIKGKAVKKTGLAQVLTHS